MVTNFDLRENEWMKVRVQSYSARKADERPLRFWLDGDEYAVQEVPEQWYRPEHIYFKIRAEDGNFYILQHQTSVPDGDWELVPMLKSAQQA